MRQRVITSTAEKVRAWQGPAVLTYGFRPFFLGAALWAVIAMVLWLAALRGWLALPTALDPVSWHAHEFLYGYLGAVVAGFLLTAVPNWTGRLPIVGWPLAGLFALWIAGRGAISLSAWLPSPIVAIIDLSLAIVLWSAIAREIVVGKNWRNLVVLAMLGIFMLGNAIFHWEAANGSYAAHGYGLRLGLSASVMMIAVIGGRIVPSFTRNWLVRRGSGRLPVPPMQSFDIIALVVLLVALTLWVAAPEVTVTGFALVAAGILHLFRLVRWAGERSAPEPLVLVLHIGFAFLPIGALALAADILVPGMPRAASAEHLWLAGAIGVMTLAVMTRATLGHTGRALTAGVGTTLLYAAIVAAAATRLVAGLWPAMAPALHAASALAWITAFGGFAVVYGRLLLRPRETG